MEKKAYTKPTATIYQMNAREGFLDVSGKDTLGKGGSAKSAGVTEGDTKEAGSWNVWGDDE